MRRRVKPAFAFAHVSPRDGEGWPKAWRFSAKAISRSSTRRLTLPWGKLPSPSRSPCFLAGQECDPLVNRFHRINLKFARLHRLHHVPPQHEVLHVGGWNQHALLAREPPRLAEVKNHLNLLIDAADGLTSPRWFTEPVTARDCLMGVSARAESSA